MKKIFFSLALATVLLASTSGFNEERFSIRAGGQAPRFTVENATQTFSPGDTGKRYTLITFWESSDAVSRVSVGQYQALVNSDEAVANLVLPVGINFDTTSALFEEIVKADGLDATNQYRVEGNAATELRARYGLDSGMGSILIGPDGKVVTYNPTAEYLKALETSKA